MTIRTNGERDLKTDKRRLAVAAAVAAVVAFGSGWLLFGMFHEAPVRAFSAAWAYRTDDPKLMARDVDAVVVATLVRTSPGRVAYSSDPSDSVPFELNEFRVEQGWKQLKTGALVTVERVGGAVNGERVLFDSDGGPYVTGQRYLLFLKKQPGSEVFYLINDEGRYALDGIERLVPAARSGRVADKLRNEPLQKVRALLQSALQQPPKRSASSLGVHPELVNREVQPSQSERRSS